jgi:hypothetical protein
MGIFGVVIIIVLWALIPFGMGMYARKHGLTFWFIFLISFFFTPLIGLIAFAVDASQKRKAYEQKRAQAGRAKTTMKWACLKCGTLNSGAFCSSCGSPRPTPEVAKASEQGTTNEVKSSTEVL